jgi:hydrogenase maturation protein HypF
LILNGRVQGLGVRPTIFRLATDLELAGCVRNTVRGVEIEVEGQPAAVSQFADLLPTVLPAGSVLERLTTEPAEPTGRREFTIVREPDAGPLSARVPADMGVCDDCVREVRDSADRRYRYPFTSCTACGPRYTIIQHMPYERHDITMSIFPFCDPCRREYEQPGARRFHAQTNACGDCGPRIWATDEQQRVSANGDDVLPAAVSALRQGKIVALRGIGGYQLLVDATNEEAVRRLRQRKLRKSKPLAVMVASPSDARRYTQLSERELNLLSDRSNPIVLATARSNQGLALAINPGFDSLGIMLPTTPLHAMLAAEHVVPLVCTSGNREGDPLEFEVAGAQTGLAGVCDVWLHHDRPIARPIDDSVVRVMGERGVTIRLARGLAPLALDLPDVPAMLAAGGYFKNAVAWSNGMQSVLGPHIGDLDSVGSRLRYLDQCEDWHDLYRCTPRYLVHDLHPEYYSTVWSQQQELPRHAVQHHHAHVVAGMIEHHWLDRTVLGVSWDGTGFGTDGTIWGGEFLLARAARFERVGHIRPFSLPGGEAAIHEPWRVALAIVAEALGVEQSQTLPWGPRATAAKGHIQSILQRRQFSPVTSSAGRLFDAAAVFILDLEEADFEGQLAMLLEARADREAAGEYDFPVRSGTPFQLDWRPLVVAVVRDRAAGVPPATMSMRFHRTLARTIVRICEDYRDYPVILSGGVFQNRLLTELILELMPDDLGSRIGLPGVIPPNDGGLAAGQLAIAAALIKEQT